MSLSFPVTPSKNQELINRMKALELTEADLEESFVKSGGKGGQNVNKVSTAVVLKHKKSGIEIKCSIYRTQGLNRYKARAILCEKLENKLLAIEPRFEKIKKQKQKKSQKQRKKVLEELRAKENLNLDPQEFNDMD
jgi:peptide chain release factor